MDFGLSTVNRQHVLLVGVELETYDCESLFRDLATTSPSFLTMVTRAQKT